MTKRRALQPMRPQSRFSARELAGQFRLGHRRQVAARALMAGTLALARATLSPAEFRRLLVAEFAHPRPRGANASRVLSGHPPPHGAWLFFRVAQVFRRHHHHHRHGHHRRRVNS